MEQSASASFLWTCPSCGRRVPRRVDECRCGFKQADAPGEEAVAPAAETPTPRGSSRWSLLTFGLLVVAGVALFIAQSQTKPEAAAGQPPRVATTPPPDSASAAASVSNDATDDTTSSDLTPAVVVLSPTTIATPPTGTEPAATGSLE